MMSIKEASKQKLSQILYRKALDIGLQGSGSADRNCSGD